MQVRLMDPITRFEKIQEKLTQLLIKDPQLSEAYAGFGISEDPMERTIKIVALCTKPIDPGWFERLLAYAEEADPRWYDPPDFELIETGHIRAASRPAAGGDGIQLHGGPVGTLGCMVVDRQQNELFLSCNHVIADCNTAFLLGAAIGIDPNNFIGGNQPNQAPANIGAPAVSGK